VFIGHLRTLEHVMWSVAPTRLDHCLSPMHSESTWFTSVRSLAETDSPGRAQTETRLAASPGVSDMVAFQENPAKLWLYGQQLPTSDSRQATHYGMSAPMVPYQPYQGATAFKPIPEPPVSRWKPRSKTGHTLWRNQLNDRLATYDLLDTSYALPPSLDHMNKTYPYMSDSERYDCWRVALGEYRAENTALYHLIFSTIDLSGIREETDIAHITRHFHHGVHRDGNGLLHWLDSFADCSATGEQDRLQTSLADAKLPPGGVTIPVLEKHFVDILTMWTKITGNDISQPASFNARLLSSIPPSSTGHVGSLRAWLADKITDGASFLSEPESLIEKLLAHARTLGMPQGGSEARGTGGLYAVLRNDCHHCTARVCTAGAKKDDCVCFNPRKPVPAEASDGERNFVFTARKYIAICKPDSIKKISLADMKEKTKADSSDAVSSPPPAPVAAGAGAAATPIISNQAEFNAWFQKSMNTTTGTRKVVNVVAPIAEEGGLAPMIAKPNPMRDLCVNMIASPANCADVFTKPSVHMVTPRPHPRGSPLRDSRSACPDLRSPLSTGFGHGAPVFAPPRRATPPPPSVATPLRLLGWATVPRAAYDAIVAKISNSNSDERKSALLALALVWIAVRRFSSPVASLLAARWARVRDALLRIALRIVRALSVGAARVTMAASAAEPQLAGALA
jgi:hypothetical protein